MKAMLKLFFKFFRKLDKMLLLATVCCSGFGILQLYSMMVNSREQYITNINVSYTTQLVACLMGISIALFLSLIDYHMIAKLWYLYAPACLGMTMLLFVFGRGRDGADDINWLDIGPISIQPSEFLKIAFILSFAYHIFKTQEKFNKPLNVALLCVHGMVPIGLIAIQGDHGTAIVFCCIFVAMLFVGGISWKYIAAAFLALPVGIILLWNYVLESHHKKRIQILFNPDLDPTGVGNQQRQGKIALGSGQLNGKGLFGGRYSYVTEQHNDFIFSYVGQTVGFIGCAILCVVLAYICYRIISNASMAQDKLGQMICVGVFAQIFAHCILNIGMVLGVMPVIGVPLPFISQGGTAMLTMFVSIGLVLSVYSHSGKNANILYFGK